MELGFQTLKNNFQIGFLMLELQNNMHWEWPQEWQKMV